MQSTTHQIHKITSVLEHKITPSDIDCHKFINLQKNASFDGVNQGLFLIMSSITREISQWATRLKMQHRDLKEQGNHLKTAIKEMKEKMEEAHSQIEKSKRGLNALHRQKEKVIKKNQEEEEKRSKFQEHSTQFIPKSRFQLKLETKPLHSRTASDFNMERHVSPFQKRMEISDTDLLKPCSANEALNLEKKKEFELDHLIRKKKNRLTQVKKYHNHRLESAKEQGQMVINGALALCQQSLLVALYVLYDRGQELRSMLRLNESFYFPKLSRESTLRPCDLHNNSYHQYDVVSSIQTQNKPVQKSFFSREEEEKQLLPIFSTASRTIKKDRHNNQFTSEKASVKQFEKSCFRVPQFGSSMNSHIGPLCKTIKERLKSEENSGNQAKWVTERRLQTNCVPPTQHLDTKTSKENVGDPRKNRSQTPQELKQQQPAREAKQTFDQRTSCFSSVIDLGQMSERSGLESIRSLRMRQNLKIRSHLQGSKSQNSNRMNQRYSSIDDGDKLLHEQEERNQKFTSSPIVEMAESNLEESEVNRCLE